MKKSLLIAATALIGASVFAQTTVTSANIVGYYKDTSPAAALHIASYSFDGTNSTPDGVFGDQLPIGTRIYTFDPVEGYSISTYEEQVDYSSWPFTTNYAWSADLNLSGASGFWVENLDASEQVSVLSGDVPMDDIVTNSIVAGLQLISYPYPTSMALSDMELNPAVGERAYVYNGSYQIATFEEQVDYSSWPFTTNTVWSTNLTVEVGQGFWYEATEAKDWVVNRPF